MHPVHAIYAHLVDVWPLPLIFIIPLSIIAACYAAAAIATYFPRYRPVRVARLKRMFREDFRKWKRLERDHNGSAYIYRDSAIRAHETLTELGA